MVKFDEGLGFSHNDDRLDDIPHAFIQWKGTDVCLDFHCVCDYESNTGDFGHFDGYFAYRIKCDKCGRVWEMPWHVFPREVTQDNESIEPVELQYELFAEIND